MTKKKSDNKVLFDGRYIADTIEGDPALYCGYHPNADRCGRPTYNIMAFNEERGATWLPICDQCRPIATDHQGRGFTFHTRFKESL